MFVLNSEITIGKFRFSGVKDVIIRRSIHSISDTATIILPSISRIVKNGKSTPDTIITGKQFADGDPVTIKLGYNGDLQTEFRGFVRHRDLNMPLEINCEGYSWLLRRNTISTSWDSITVKDLLAEAVSDINPDYKINVQCDVDYLLHHIRVNESGFDIISNILKYTDGNLCCFFIQPDTLWCGLAYTPSAANTDVFKLGKVNYKLGYNLLKDNSLTERNPETDPVKVTYNKRLSNGNLISQTSDVYDNAPRTHNRTLNHINDAPVLKALANEKAYQLNYSGYEGSIHAFLQPFATPGYVANVTDDRYPERNGQYVIESTEVTFGTRGARRIVEIGPKVGTT